NDSRQSLSDLATALFDKPTDSSRTQTQGTDKSLFFGNPYNKNDAAKSYTSMPDANKPETARVEANSPVADSKVKLKQERFGEADFAKAVELAKENKLPLVMY